MNNKIFIDLSILKLILDQEAKKLTGKTMKRFEISTDLEIIKKSVKEVQYEWIRDLYDRLLTGKIVFDFMNKKEKE